MKGWRFWTPHSISSRDESKLALSHQKKQAKLSEDAACHLLDLRVLHRANPWKLTMTWGLGRGGPDWGGRSPATRSWERIGDPPSHLHSLLSLDPPKTQEKCSFLGSNLAETDCKWDGPTDKL